jgi:hypothetical protein
MKRPAYFSLLLVFAAVQHTAASGIVRIADGDCSSLTAATAAPVGQEPALIALARNGHYDACTINVSGNISIDGAGAQMPLFETDNGAPPQINVGSGARLSVRNLNFAYTPSPSAAAPKAPQPKFLVSFTPAIVNFGTLELDSISISNEAFGHSGLGGIGGGLIGNVGDVIMRNASIVNTFNDFSVLFGGNVEISQSTIANDVTFGHALLGNGTIRVANSLIVRRGGPVCSSSADQPAQFISLGGNIVSDTSCGFNASNDRVVADARTLDFGTHGGVVNTLALNYDSPAIGNGVVANCEATDARGLSRGQTACDSGAYEVGGGNGKLSATGMSGLYFNAANNGHYVSIQRLAGNLALVIWNTFDEAGTPAWLYGVGTVSGSQIHVEQVAQNIGGVLHAGGGVSGATPTLWGTFDVNLSDCYTASLTYDSALPQFGSGSTSLQRLAFLDGVNCAR